MFHARLIFCSFALILLSASVNAQKTSFKVMAWNILHGGNDIENGPENVAKIITIAMVNENMENILFLNKQYISDPP